MWARGDLSPGEVEGGERRNVRSDVYTFLDETEEWIASFTRPLDQLVLKLAADVPELKQYQLMRGRPMVAIYHGEGSKYTPHFDAVGGDNGRVLTCILYLNPFWRKGDGGCLRLWPEAKGLVTTGESHDIDPLHGRLAAFLCNSRNLHEVLPMQASNADA
eukprot:4789161-Amphidinium_carterae.1